MCSKKKLKEIGFIPLDDLTGTNDCWYWRKKYSNGDQHEITVNYALYVCELTFKARGIVFSTILLRWSVNMPLLVQSLGG